MGVLTDFVVANPADAERVGSSAGPGRDFGGMEAKGIDIVKLGRLHAILAGEPYDLSFHGPSSALRYAVGDEGPWVFEVPSNLVERLAGLNAGDLHSVAIAWAQTEEFSSKYGRWSPEAVHAVLGEFASLCHRAVAERKAILMWMCL